MTGSGWQTSRVAIEAQLTSLDLSTASLTPDVPGVNEIHPTVRDRNRESTPTTP